MQKKKKNHGIWSHHFMANGWETVETVTTLFFWAPKSLQMVTAAMEWKDTCSLKEKLWQSWIQFSCSVVNDSATNGACSRSLLQLMSMEMVMPSKHLILYHPLLLLPSIFPSIRVFSNESVLCVSWPKYWSFSFSISPSNKYSGLISFRIDWFDLLVVQQTLESLLQHHSSNASIFQYSAFFMVQLSHPLHDYWKKQSFD